MGQSNKPNAVAWATDPGADIVDPPAGKKLSGWEPLDIPPHGWVNWFWNLVAAWVTYLQSFVTLGSDAWVTSGLQVQPLAVPTNNQVQIAVGTAIANGQEVELTALEIHIVPVNAGTAAPGALQAIHYVINENGSVSPVLLPGTFPDRDAALRSILPGGVNDEGTLRASLGMVFNESGAALYDIFQIVDTRQLLAVSSRVIPNASLRQGDLIDPPIRWSMNLNTIDEGTAKETSFDLNPINASGFGSVLSLMSNQSHRVQIKVFRQGALTTPADYGSSGIGYRGYRPFAAAAVGGSEDTVGIHITEAVAGVVPTDHGDNGGLNLWSGDLDVQGDYVITFSRLLGMAEEDYVVEISNDQGITVTQLFTFRAT